MIRTYNYLLAILVTIVALLWQLPADGGQIFKVEGRRAPGMGQPPSLSDVPFTGWMNVADGFTSLRTAIKFNDDPAVRLDEFPVRLNLADALPSGLDIRNFSKLSDQNAVFMLDPTAGTSFDPLSLTDWNVVELYYQDGVYGSITSAIPVTEPNGIALLSVGGFLGVLFFGRLVTGNGSRHGMC